MSADLLAENAARNARLDAPYDPITGEGSLEERRALRAWEGEPPPGYAAVYHLPVQMWEAEPPAGAHPDGPQRDPTLAAVLARCDEAGSIEAAARQGGDSVEAVLAWIMFRRHRFDFEFWAATSATIQDDRGELSRLRLWRPQRLYLRALLEMFWRGAPMRVILLKARQWGGSTLTQLFMAWVQQWHRVGWNAAIVADDQSQARHILGMYETLAEHYPLAAAGLPITLRPYRGSTNVKVAHERRCYIGVGSVKEPNAVRSYTFHMLHLSEVGLWKSTPVQNADDLAQSLEGGLASGRADLPFTLCVKESTAKGVGTYFHQEWVAATRGESNDVPVFVAWFEIPKYRRDLEGESAAFAASWDAYERALWDVHGCSLEQISWYRWKLRSFRGKRWRMQAEYPTTPEEAFQSTGHRYFSHEAVTQARRTCREPAWRGELRARAKKGAEALLDLALVESEHGRLEVWRRPGDLYGGLLDLEGGQLRVTDRFVAFADPGGKRETADYSVVVVVDRAPLLWGGAPEVVARWRGHLRPDLFAWTCAQLCAWYDEALLAFEVNRYRRASGDEERGFEPEWSIAVLEEIHQHYERLYLREKEGRADEPVTLEIGFHMNQLTKPMLVATMDEALEEGLYVERSAQTCDELDSFEAKPDGRLGAVAGQYDDAAIATMGAVWLALKAETVPAPERVPVRAVAAFTPGRPSAF